MMYRLISLLLLTGFSLCLQAEISITPIIVDLGSKNQDTEIAVKNFDLKNKAYVEITPYRLPNPANPAGLKQRVTDPKKDGLVVFPSKLVLAPGQTQFVRILKTTKSLETDQVYEVDFIPKVSTELMVSDGDAKTPTLGVRVVVGYGARVTLRPDKLRPQLFVKRVKNELVIKNTGNTSLRISSCTQCIGGKKIEIPLPAYTIFAGQTIKKELSQLSPVKLEALLIDKPLGQFHIN